MAEINTKYFGQLSYSSDEVLHFQDGLFGFEGERNFLLIRFINEDSSMLCLQSIEEEDLAFIVINPFHFMPEYTPRLTKSEMDSLEATDEKELLYYAICTIQEDMSQSTANLKCPIVVNPERNNIARQIIMDDTEYQFKHFFGALKPTKEA